jgi:cysteine synthase A
MVPYGMSRIPVNIAEHVGRTPMVQFTRVLPEHPDVELFGKLEAFNPGGSVKDRIGVAMIEAAEREGRIEPGRTKITESLGGMNEAVDAARAMARGGDVFLPDQFSNPANPAIHRATTGPEIWEATDGRVDVFVAGVGTGGTITGAGEALKERDPAVRVVAVEPRASAVLSGHRPGPHKIQGIGAGFVPAVLNRELLDEVIAVDDEDAIATARLLARREGVLAGISGGAAAWAAMEIAKRPDSKGKRIVTVLPDSGERYVSTPFFAP